MKIILPFPHASLSGHAKGHWRSKATPTVKHRRGAYLATEDAFGEDHHEAIKAYAGKFDVPIHIRFVPPNRRGDRINYPIRIKAQIDGIALAMGINDRRFLPSYEFCEPEKPGRVEFEL